MLCPSGARQAGVGQSTLESATIRNMGKLTVFFLLIAFALLNTACVSGSRLTSTPTVPVPATASATLDALHPTDTAALTPTESATAFIFSNRVQPRERFCPDAPATRLILQERGRVTDEDDRALRMRESPGTDNPIVAQIPVGGVFFVLEGAVCEEVYAWYRVRYRGDEGWIAEGDLEVYYVEPYLPG